MGSFVKYHADTDVLYVRADDSEKPVRSDTSDDSRIIDYGENGEVIAVEFIGASDGIDLAGLPAPIEKLVYDADLGLPIFA
jgi:uncharacterized protein YuzE